MIGYTREQHIKSYGHIGGGLLSSNIYKSLPLNTINKAFHCGKRFSLILVTRSCNHVA